MLQKRFRPFLGLLLAALICVTFHSTADAQHGATVRVQGGKSEWVKLLIESINTETGVDAWKTHDVMRCRMAFTCAQSDENSEEANEKECDKPHEPTLLLAGDITYDVPARRLRLDLDGELTLLVERNGLIAAWCRGEESTTLTRDEIPHEAVDTARALAYLLVLPLRINDDDIEFGPSGYQVLEDEPFHMGALRVKPVKDVDEGVIHVARSYPDDWYNFFTSTYQPFRIRAVTYRVFDRSRELTEFPRPRAVYFDEYVEVDGVAIPSEWSIFNFSRVDGVGDHIANATVSQIAFPAREADTFDIPKHALHMR